MEQLPASGWIRTDNGRLSGGTFAPYHSREVYEYSSGQWRVRFWIAPNKISGQTALEDAHDGTCGVSSHVARLRHAAVSSIVQATAIDKLNRSLESKTRQAGERLELKLGDSIDFSGSLLTRTPRVGRAQQQLQT